MDMSTLEAVTSAMEVTALVVISLALAWIPRVLIGGSWGTLVGMLALGVLLIADSRLLTALATPRKRAVSQ